jgi:predicted phosphatase
MEKYVTKVTAEKPRAVAYIDDKGIRFENNWKHVLEVLDV